MQARAKHSDRNKFANLPSCYSEFDSQADVATDCFHPCRPGNIIMVRVQSKRGFFGGLVECNPSPTARARPFGVLERPATAQGFVKLNDRKLAPGLDPRQNVFSGEQLLLGLQVAKPGRV